MFGFIGRARERFASNPSADRLARVLETSAKEVSFSAKALRSLLPIAILSTLCTHCQRDGAQTRLKTSAPTSASQHQAKTKTAPSARTGSARKQRERSPVSDRPCPNEMVLVDGRVCVDRYETALFDDQNRRFSPYYPVDENYEGLLYLRKKEQQKLLEEDDAGVASRTDFPPLPPWQEQKKPPKYFAHSKPGLVPNGYLSMQTAKAACENAKKRLCTLDEWQTACRGDQGSAYPYGERYQRHLCNLARGKHPSRALFGRGSASVVDPRLNLMTKDDLPLLRKTGESKACRSTWGKDALYDMVGNLDEWIDHKKGVFVGGTYSRYTKKGCYAAISAHPPGYWDYSTGTRCCKTPVDSSTPTSEKATSKADRQRKSQFRRMFQAEQFELARSKLFALEKKAPHDRTLRKLIDESLDKDPVFFAPPRTIGLEGAHTAIKYLGGGSTITLRLMAKDEVLGVLKPQQSRRQSNYRSEIAAYRLCALVRCSFYIPKNVPIKIRRETFETLYARIESDKQKAYRERHFETLIYQKKDDQEWLFATFKDWVKGLTNFPVEHTEIWQPWLSLEPEQSQPLKSLETPAIDAYTAEDTRNSLRHHRALGRSLRGMSQRKLAEQISDVIVFDYLITNWDRMSQKKNLYGANCHIAGGRLVSIDNGASFQHAIHPIVGENLHRVQRFRRQTVRAIRRLRRERTLKMLFPNASADERARFRVFWGQRQRLLKYVASLIAQHGRDKVLAFK